MHYHQQTPFFFQELPPHFFIFQKCFLSTHFVNSAPNFFQISEVKNHIQTPISETSSQSQPEYVKKQDLKNQKQKLNIKNIIPNLARKLLVFLCSSQCHKLIKQFYSNVQKSQISKIKAFVCNIKKSIGCSYVGKKDLKKLWKKDDKSHRKPQFYQILRSLSRYYLEDECMSSIVQSKRMKPELKNLHLRYCRKLLSFIREVQI